MTNSGDPGSYSPISADFPEYNDTTGPVDPVFVDEESSGEAVASAADHEDLDEMTGFQGPCPPLPGKSNILNASYEMNRFHGVFFVDIFHFLREFLRQILKKINS